MSRQWILAECNSQTSIPIDYFVYCRFTIMAMKRTESEKLELEVKKIRKSLEEQEAKLADIEAGLLLVQHLPESKASLEYTQTQHKYAVAELISRLDSE